MFDVENTFTPKQWPEIQRRTAASGFDMPSDANTGMLLRTLAASKPGGRLLELGTGTGLATAWLLAGMSDDASLVSIDIDEGVQAIARDCLGDDPRVNFVLGDAVAFLRAQPEKTFDLIFADAWAGKYEARHIAMGLVKRGGFYIGDDMLPQPNWPDGHQPRVDALLAELFQNTDWSVVAPDWGSGFVIATRL